MADAQMERAKRRPGAPPGWSYNPSAWSERIPLLVLAAVGLASAIYTALSQLGVVGPMWDPFFGSHSSYLVTHSALSRALPVPDGVLGVVGYLCDLGFGALGGPQRWRTAPWTVALFALTITGLGIIALGLTIAQGAFIGHWCSVCLVSAAVSTLVFGLGIGEALAAGQEVRRRHAAGASWRRALVPPASASARTDPKRTRQPASDAPPRRQAPRRRTHATV